MQNQIQIFKSEEFGRVRVVQNDGEFWWVLKDVCDALGLGNVTAVSRRLDDDERCLIKVNTFGGNQAMTAISESGLYAVILRSDKQKAREFRRWLTSDVIPTIRRHGAYITDTTLARMREDSALSESLLETLSAERTKYDTLVDYVETLQPKVEYCNAVLSADNSIPVSIIAKDYGMSALAFNKLLHAFEVQYKVGGVWVLYAKHANCGYTVSKTYRKPDGTAEIYTHWTQLGRMFLYDLLSWHGIYPQSEDEYKEAS